MTYTAYWFRYPHGKEGEPMVAQWREFDDIDKAIYFIRRKADLTKAIYWAGAHVEDEDGNYIFHIYDNYYEEMEQP